MKIGFIGHGKHAQSNLYPAIKYLNIPIQAIATSTLESADYAKAQHNAAACYIDYKKMFAQENLDCVFICVSDKLHPQIVKNSLIAGLHVFVEKPLSQTLDEAIEIHNLSQQTGKNVQVGYMKRYAVPYQKILKIQPEIGEIISINVTFGCRKFADDALDFLLQAAIHSINLVQSYAGSVQKVKSTISESSDYVAVSAIALGTNNIPVSLTLMAADAWTKLNEEIIITGSKGYIKYNNNTGLEMHINPINNPAKPRWQTMDEVTNIYTTVSTTSSGAYQDLYQKGFIPEINHFIECVKNNKTPLTDTLDNQKTIEWLEAIYKNRI